MGSLRWTRRSAVVLSLLGLLACHAPSDVHGVYVAQGGSGMFFPCDDPQSALLVPDSTLAARYQSIVPRDQGAYVQLRGINTRAGSVYSGRRYFVVQHILELRPRAAGECPRVAHPVAAIIPS